ncbi:MAG TPA: heavy metal-binding domain-containing protein, partial [Acidimicrobiales bacterium]|nr:heavy metal-binding domain-containing protein [Acidimicrobiales bacterium]
RELALSRMQAEAQRDNAAGIVGVRTEVYNHVWGEHATEFLALGTAIRPLEGAPQLTKPSLVLGMDR